VIDPAPGERPADPRDAVIREQAERIGEQERRLAAGRADRGTGGDNR